MDRDAAGIVGVLIILQPEDLRSAWRGSSCYSARPVCRVRHIREIPHSDRYSAGHHLLHERDATTARASPDVFIFEWVTPAPNDIPWMLAWGLSGLFAHYTMAQALKLADITIISRSTSCVCP